MNWLLWSAPVTNHSSFVDTKDTKRPTTEETNARRRTGSVQGKKSFDLSELATQRDLSSAGELHMLVSGAAGTSPCMPLAFSPRRSHAVV